MKEFKKIDKDQTVADDRKTLLLEYFKWLDERGMLDKTLCYDPEHQTETFLELRERKKTTITHVKIDGIIYERKKGGNCLMCAFEHGSRTEPICKIIGRTCQYGEYWEKGGEQ